MDRSRIVVGATVLAVFASVAAADALGREAKVSGNRFLRWNDTHKSVYISGLMDAEEQLVTACAPKATADQLSKVLADWLKKHPVALRKPAHRAFIRAVSDQCKQ